MEPTFGQVKREAQRRVREDGKVRVVFITENAAISICFLGDWRDRPILDRALVIVWPNNKVEIVMKGKR